jgi:hypothetical protein
MTAQKLREGEEEWREVPGYPGFSASRDGRVRGKRGQVLKGRLDDDGYVRLTHYASGCYRKIGAHKCVLLAWVGPAPSPRHTPAHGDGVRANNALLNLRWATPEEQWADRVRHGNGMVGEAHPQAVITLSQAKSIKAALARGEKKSKVAAAHAVPRSTVYNIAYGHSWGHA